MVQPDLEQLYRALMHTHFAFVPRGEHALREVYSAVQSQYPTLCDDTFLCSTNCRSGHKRPEWQHVVRKALNDLKKRIVMLLYARKEALGTSSQARPQRRL